MNASLFLSVFERSIEDYHRSDDVDAPMANPFPEDSLEALLYLKNWIDTVQWHLEDIIRDPAIDPASALLIKRRIDRSNQHRTDVVEDIDAFLLHQISSTAPQNAPINTETPAWAIDRLSILALKIYHMRQETLRADAIDAHRTACQRKLDILLLQRNDLSGSIDTLLEDIIAGRKRMRLYKQMKMYNDESLNPILYRQKN
ncbi:MAG: DUF4254 domain-containing protein [Chitinophagaceae bacterium]|jgi:hypothetical protein|nr:DUF4254 domain-containing protein [Chitinophagaceae bacterium]